MSLSELFDSLVSRTSARLRSTSRSQGSVVRPGVGRRSIVLLIALVTTMFTALISPAGAGDANNDGRDELAIGVPREDINELDDAGALWVMVGTTSGPADGTVINEGTSGAAGSLEAGDGFGNAVAWGDFNGDNGDDLAVGVSDQDVAGSEDAGAVTVFPGSNTGFTVTGSKHWTLSSDLVVGTAAEDDSWGQAMATGDFNGDTYDDLAVGAPWKDVGAVPGGGTVTVLYGSPTGITGLGSTEWSEDATGVAGSADDFELFGSALAAGDFNNDGRDDLAIGVRENIGSDANAGAVTVLKGSASGITATGSKQWHQDTSGVPGSGETGDLWGTVLATGDFDNNGRDDLAIGAPTEDVGSIDSAGAVTLLKGSSSGLTTTGSRTWHSDTSGVPGAAEAQDRVGSALAAGDFDNNGRDDLAIGVSGESIGEQAFAGAVVVMKGSASTGLTTSGSKQWHSNTSGVPGAIGYRDYFGESLAAGDFNGGGRDDLAIGVPGDGPGAAHAGSVVVLRGSSTGLGTTSAMELYQGFGAPGVGEIDDGFGTALN